MRATGILTGAVLLLGAASAVSAAAQEQRGSPGQQADGRAAPRNPSATATARAATRAALLPVRRALGAALGCEDPAARKATFQRLQVALHDFRSAHARDDAVTLELGTYEAWALIELGQREQARDALLAQHRRARAEVRDGYSRWVMCQVEHAANHGAWELARLHLEEAMARAQGEDAAAMWDLQIGDLVARQGDSDAAVQHYCDVGKRRPAAFAQANMRAIRLQVRCDHLDAVVTLCRGLVATAPDSPEAEEARHLLKDAQEGREYWSRTRGATDAAERPSADVGAESSHP